MKAERKVALVTGAGTGLGREIALAMGWSGARVAVNYSRSQDAAEQVAGEIERDGGKALAVRADVADSAAVTEMVTTVERALGPVDVLVNNAGITRYIPFSDIGAITEERWRRILDVNLTGAFLCAQAVAPGMVARSAGKIVNVATNSAFTSTGSSIPYVVSKAALVSLTTCLARALAPAVQVNAVAPGWMATDWLDRYLPSERAAEIRSGAVPLAPLEDVVDCLMGLVANDSITGHVAVVDRGEMLG